MTRRPPTSTLFPYTTLFRSARSRRRPAHRCVPTRRSCSAPRTDRKSTRLNSSHEWMSYAVFCLNKKSESREALIEHASDFCQGSIRDLTFGLDENCPHRTAGKREGNQQPLGGKSNEVEPLENAVVEPWPKCDAELLSDDTQTLCGAAKNSLDGRTTRSDLRTQLVLLAQRSPRYLHQRI